MIPDWLQPTVVLFPILIWFFLGVGILPALALLPRSDRRKPARVIALALALGPLLTTAAMFFLGTFGHFTRESILAASVIGALVGTGFGLAIGRYIHVQDKALPAESVLATIDYILIAVIAIAVLLRFWNTAYWPYTTYDEFWVYGYNAKLFMLRGLIPPEMSYYPQLIPLSYTFMQSMWGGLSDHAARTVVPVFALGSILMVYVLGEMTFDRRVGLVATAIWALYPQHAAWSQFGDLEVPVTLYFTGTAAFFIGGWRLRNPRYSIVSGLMLAGALWTKPTSGALIESLILIGCGALLIYFRNRAFEIQRAVRYVILAGLVALPIGGMWYIRNMLLGHAPLVFPAGYWQAAAQRSGAELGWPLLVASGVFVMLIWRRERIGAAIAGFTLFSALTLMSAFGGRFPTLSEGSAMLTGGIPSTLTPTHLTLPGYVGLAIAVGLLMWAALPLWRSLTGELRQTLVLVTAFIIPYFVTWFWSYSYHYRLSFAIVPLFAVIIGVFLARIGAQLAPRPLYTLAGAIVIVALALPGWFATLSALEPAITEALPDDHAKIAQGNPALMGLVDFLNRERDRLGRPLKIEAPGELRLAFFFPQDDIRAGDYPIQNGNYPTLLDQVADVDYFIDSSVGQRLYNEVHKFDHNQILSSLTRLNAMRRVYTTDDGNFRFSAYVIYNEKRFETPHPNGVTNVQVGGFTTLTGNDLSRLDVSSGDNLYLTLWWQDISPAAVDYSTFIHLWNPATGQAVAIWGGQPMTGAVFIWQNVPGAHFDLAYPTRLWEPHEVIKDEWRIAIPKGIPPGIYELRVGLFDPATGVRQPVTQHGANIGDSVLINKIKVK
jgi:hypothetical protein